jgi:hypothetical protein
MAKKVAKETNPKRVAYEKKQQEKGEKIVMWIIGVLIVFGIIYALWANLMVA